MRRRNAAGITVAALCGAIAACDSGPTAPPLESVPVRIVTFGDSNTDGGWNGAEPEVVVRSYVSRMPLRLSPTDPNHPLQLAGKIELRWRAVRDNPITAVNHGIGATGTGGGMGGGPDRHVTGSPNARTEVDGITRFEAEVLGRQAPEWHGGEPENTYYPDGPIQRTKAFEPGEYDFAYVSIGTNDPTSGIPASQTIANLEWMVDQWLSAGLPAAHFILTTLAPRDQPTSADFPLINQAIRGLAASRGIHVIDLADHTSPDDGITWLGEGLHVGDELHYAEAVRDWIAGEVVDHLRRLVPAHR